MERVSIITTQSSDTITGTMLLVSELAPNPQSTGEALPCVHWLPQQPVSWCSHWGFMLPYMHWVTVIIPSLKVFLLSLSVPVKWIQMAKHVHSLEWRKNSNTAASHCLFHPRQFYNPKQPWLQPAHSYHTLGCFYCCQTVSYWIRP